MARKIGRNDPCSCGSHKKYKKCCLNKEDASRRGGEATSYDVTELNNLMDRGYDFMEDGNAVGACEVWLELWNKIKKLIPKNVTSVEEANKIFPFNQLIQFLFNWCRDLEIELANAGAVDKSFYRKEN